MIGREDNKFIELLREAIYILRDLYHRYFNRWRNFVWKPFLAIVVVVLIIFWVLRDALSALKIPLLCVYGLSQLAFILTFFWESKTPDCRVLDCTNMRYYGNYFTQLEVVWNVLNLALVFFISI